MNLQNLIDYCKAYEIDDPLSGISVPEPIDKGRVRAAIMMRCGLLEPIYPEPEVFRQMLAQWFDNRAWNFEHLIKIIQAEYSPIENTDRYSDHRITRDGSDTTTHSGSDIINTQGSENAEAGGTDTETRTPNLTSTRTDEISAENASGYQPDSRHTDADTGSETTQTQHGKTNDITRSETQTTQHGHVEKKSYDGGESYTEHTHGNIGVTTNQQMITEELELIKRFNIYDWIAERVEADLFVMVY